MNTNNKLEQRSLLNSWLNSGHDDDVDGEPIAFSRAMDSDADVEAEHPLVRQLNKAKLGVSTLAKQAPVRDLGWDDEFIPGFVAKAEALPEASQARLAKTYAVIDKIFAGHQEETAEAKRIAKQILVAERMRVLAAA